MRSGGCFPKWDNPLFLKASDNEGGRLKTFKFLGAFCISLLLLGGQVWADEDASLIIDDIPDGFTNAFDSAEGADEPITYGGGAFGTNRQDYWIAATQFAPRDGVFWTYQGFLYFAHNTGGGAQWEAQVNLPAGALVDTLECFFYDTDGALNANARMWRQSYDYTTDSPGIQAVSDTVASSGSSGYQRPFDSGINTTLRYRDGDDRNIYTIVLNMPSSLGVRFRGCRIFWQRQISPAPLTNSFSDVPTSHPFFQQIEALVDAGVTLGCGGGNYCPNEVVTREQMAAFMARLGGLHWPY